MTRVEWRLSLVMIVSLLSIVLSGCGDSATMVQPANAQTGTPQPCTNATIKGTYGFQRNGTTTSGPLTAVGLVVIDGAGNSVAQQTISRSGTFSNVTNQLGPYTVNADCTGTFNDPTTGAPFAQFVIVSNGGEILGMSLTAGNNVAIHYTRISN